MWRKHPNRKAQTVVRYVYSVEIPESDATDRFQGSSNERFPTVPDKQKKVQSTMDPAGDGSFDRGKKGPAGKGRPGRGREVLTREGRPGRGGEKDDREGSTKPGSWEKAPHGGDSPKIKQKLHW